MTFGGVQMIVLLLLIALVLFGAERRHRIVAACFLPLLWFALILNLTRSVFLLGLPAGALYLLFRWKPKALIAIPILAAIAWFAVPFQVRERVASVLSPHGQVDSNSHRTITRRTGWQMVKAHPVLGLGPEQIKPQFLRYTPADIPRPLPPGWYGHLHNIYLQYAAERGIPALLCVLWLIAAAIRWNLHRTVYLNHASIARHHRRARRWLLRIQPRRQRSAHHLPVRHRHQRGRTMRVALIHYWLLGHRGGEKVLEAIAELFPQADIFTLFYDPHRVSPVLRARNVQASYLNPLRRFHRHLLPLMPTALESFDLRPYDLVISSESGPAKGVLTSANTRHICYCHTPMRYLWELYPAYRREFSGGPLGRAAGALISNYLRTWDATTALRVDRFLANSRNVRRRIWRVYRRKSRVVYPPVAIDHFYHRPSEDYLLLVSEMVSYKRLDYAIRLCSRTGHKLKVVGFGPEYKSLRRIAAPHIEFCGRVPDDQLAALYARSRAFLMPGEEDFGITMVEALASGKPVIALARGGANEIVTDGCGLLYDEPTEPALESALNLLDTTDFSHRSPPPPRPRILTRSLPEPLPSIAVPHPTGNLRSFYNPLTPSTTPASYHPGHDDVRSPGTN